MEELSKNNKKLSREIEEMSENNKKLSTQMSTYRVENLQDFDFRLAVKTLQMEIC